jgi:hypothetical protein
MSREHTDHKLIYILPPAYKITVVVVVVVVVVAVVSQS